MVREDGTAEAKEAAIGNKRVDRCILPNRMPREATNVAQIEGLGMGLYQASSANRPITRLPGPLRTRDIAAECLEAQFH